MPVIVYSKNPLSLDNDEQHIVPDGTNLKRWMDSNGYLKLMHEESIIVILNGVELMEVEYDIELTVDDKVAIATQMEGIDPFTIFLVVVFVVAVTMYLTMLLPENPNRLRA